MEAAFGHDFSRVRVHTDEIAGELTSRLEARAFTVGSDIAFAAGAYRPGTPLGDALLAHELAHVMQQDDAGVEAQAAEDQALERDADRSAVGVLAALRAGVSDIGRNAWPRLRTGLSLQRCPDKEKPAPACDKSLYPVPHGIIPAKLPVLDCSSPTPVTLAELRSNPVPGNTLGFTDWKPAAFERDIQEGAGGRCHLVWIARPKLQTNIYAFTKPGTYDDGQETPSTGPCAGRLVNVKKKFTKSFSDGTKAAEIEHCQDARVAWSKTFARVEQFYDELAGGFCADPTCTDEMNRRMKLRTGFADLADIEKKTLCLFGRTKLRDDNGWHDAMKTNPVYSKDCKEVVYTMGPGPKSQIGQPSSADLIKGCGVPD
jgi:hypothetical protein